jgi:hypothetical protein
MNDWMMMEMVSVNGGVGLLKQVKRRRRGHGNGNGIEYGNGEKRKCERRKGMHRIGGSKQAIDERVSGAVSDACSKLAVCHCKPQFESVYTKVQQASISCPAHVDENYGGFNWWF